MTTREHRIQDAEGQQPERASLAEGLARARVERRGAPLSFRRGPDGERVSAVAPSYARPYP